LIDFRSDNTGAVAPEILAAVAEANSGTAAGYGMDRWSAELHHRFSDLFQAEASVYPIATGTAANGLSLSVLGPPWGAVYCSCHAHIETSEANAAGFHSGGLKLSLVEGEFGKLSPLALESAIVESGIGLRQRSQPAAVSLSQASELGTVYSLDELSTISAIARRFGIRIHMDGARLANALVHLGCTPADLVNKAGVDILSFGAAKNGGMLCDAIVVFDRSLVEPLEFRLRRSGHTWSKMRFAAAQLLAYVHDGLWLRNAARANTVAEEIGRQMAAMDGLSLAMPIEANEIFLNVDGRVMDGLERDGIGFFRRGPATARFVCRFDTTESEAEALLSSIRRHAAQIQAIPLGTEHSTHGSHR
jgi:threonine aldolase